MRFLLTLLLPLSLLSAKAATTLPTSLQDTTQVTEKEVTYAITQDATYFYVSLATQDKETGLSLLHTGVTIYFDEKGKKKKEVYVKYPFANDRNRVYPRKSLDEGENKEFNKTIESVMENLPAEAAYGHEDSVQQFNKDLNNLNISLGWDYDEADKTLQFQLKIPKQLIAKKQSSDFNKLSVGVVSNTMERKKPNKSDGGQVSGGRSGNGGRGGGRGGQRPSGQRPERGVDTPNAKGTGAKPEPVFVDVWFDANLRTD